MGHAVHQRLMGQEQMELVHTSDKPAQLLRELVQSAGLGTAPRLDQI